jgi:hypothetical protein
MVVTVLVRLVKVLLKIYILIKGIIEKKSTLSTLAVILVLSGQACKEA